MCDTEPESPTQPGYHADGQHCEHGLRGKIVCSPSHELLTFVIRCLAGVASSPFNFEALLTFLVMSPTERSLRGKSSKDVSVEGSSSQISAGGFHIDRALVSKSG